VGRVLHPERHKILPAFEKMPPQTARRVAVPGQFVSHGFAGAIKAWLTDGTLTADDLVTAVTACAPTWWH
jgi:hypothetical protein